MLDLPHVVDAQPVGQLHLFQGVGQQPALVALAGGAGKLVLVEEAEAHGPEHSRMAVGLGPRSGPEEATLWDPLGVLHHVSLEVAPDDVEATIGFFELLGFSSIAAPEAIAPFAPGSRRTGPRST